MDFGLVMAGINGFIAVVLMIYCDRSQKGYFSLQSRYGSLLLTSYLVEEENKQLKKQIEESKNDNS